jgi:hypothetical protein
MAINGHIVTVIEGLDFKEAWNIKDDGKNQQTDDIKPAIVKSFNMVNITNI